MLKIGPGSTGFTAYVDKCLRKQVSSPGRHHHECFELVYFIAGESHITINKRTYIARDGDLAIYHPGVSHYERVQAGPYHIVCLRFVPQKITVPFPGTDELEPVIHLPWPGKFRILFEQIVNEDNGVDSYSSIMVGALMAQFVVMLRRALQSYKESLLSGNADARTRIADIISLIHRNINDEVTLKDLAQKAFMSESHFSHRFKEVTGEAPKQYLIRAKIDQAKELLMHSTMTVSEIAHNVGYDNPQHFSRLFKKSCKCTPGQYRKKAEKCKNPSK